jgi:hypothetical protein
MIQLATDPRDSRPAWRPAAADRRESPVMAPRTRNGHAWPFISRPAEGATGQRDAKRTPGSESGS